MGYAIIGFAAVGQAKLSSALLPARTSKSSLPVGGRPKRWRRRRRRSAPRSSPRHCGTQSRPTPSSWRSGIRVNVLSPGPTATELAKEALGEKAMKAFASINPLQRMADPAEFGAVAAFLASPDSSFMTASEVAVDGGLAQL